MKYRRCGDNEVLVVTGCCHGRTRYVKEGSVICWPGEKLGVIHTHLRTVDLVCERLQSTTSQGDRVTLTTETVVKAAFIKENDELLAMTCELFLDKSDAEIDKVIREVTEGCHKAMAAAFKANDIVHRRHDFDKRLFEEVSCELVIYGISVKEVSLNRVKFPTDEIMDQY